MNKKYQQLVPIVFLLAIVIIASLVFVMCQVKVQDYFSTSDEIKRNKEMKQQLEEQANREKSEQEALMVKMKSLKPIYKSKIKNSSTDNLSVFGNMFQDIIAKAQGNGLLIRSIEYHMKPEKDVLYSKFPNKYNACEVKFFFVSSYGQMLDFLNDMNKNFEYLTSISEIKVMAFVENPDYLLTKISIILYSEK